SPAGGVGLREAASVVFALATLLPLLLVVLVLHRSGALWSFEAQISVLLAVTLAVLGFVVFRLMVGRVAQLAGALVGPGASARAAGAMTLPSAPSCRWARAWRARSRGSARPASSTTAPSSGCRSASRTASSAWSTSPRVRPRPWTRARSRRWTCSS